MKLLVSEEIDRYVNEHSQARPVLFDELRERTYAEVNLPQMQVGRVEGGLLKMLAGLIGAKRILEVGTFTGYSSLCMAEALPADGVVMTCDFDPIATAVAKEFFAKSPHGSKIKLLFGDAMKSIEALPRDELIDMAFLDADKARYPQYYEVILPRLRRGGLLVIDNALWSGDVLDPQTPDANGIAAVNKLATGDKRVENVLLSVRDGIMLVRKR